MSVSFSYRVIVGALVDLSTLRKDEGVTSCGHSPSESEIYCSKCGIEVRRNTIGYYIPEALCKFFNAPDGWIDVDDLREYEGSKHNVEAINIASSHDARPVIVIGRIVDEQRRLGENVGITQATVTSQGHLDNEFRKVKSAIGDSLPSAVSLIVAPYVSY